MTKIGSLKLDGEIFLAPMSDLTNAAFRTLCREQGAALVYTELISAKAIALGSRKTEKMLATGRQEKPVALQLFGSNPSDFRKAVSICEKEFDFELYDLNCGCSVNKALKGEYGVSLMGNPALVGRIISAMVSETKKPVTVKMRLGNKKENFLDVARAAEGAGAAAICLHPRLGDEMYSGKARWEKIRELKENVSAPVIGNGDINTPEKVLEIKKQTKCDFEMIGRAAVGNAFFFRQANSLIENKKIPQRTNKEIINEANRFLDLIEEFKLNENNAKPYFIGLARGFGGAAKLRGKFARFKSVDEIREIIKENF